MRGRSGSDVRYSYYAHGPLKRAEYGEDSVQGIDYTYTLQGWLKGVNHPQGSIRVGLSALNHRDYDPGHDSLDAHPNYAPDAFGMALRYHRGDFYRDAAPFHSDEASTPAGAELLNLPAWDPGTGSRDLYNGNISSWTSHTVAGPSGGANPVLIDQTLTGFTYEYDVLNRIRRSRYHVWDNVANEMVSQGNPYFSSYTYDPNGNIQTLERRDSTGTILDDFTYEYISTATNRLSYVDDAKGSTPTVGDLEQGQFAGNYSYDASGNLTGDVQELIPTGGIEWRADGKVWRVTKSGGAPDELKFSYNASGDRVIKKVSDNGVERRLFYVREAGGRVLAIYEQVCEPPYTGENDPARDWDGDEIPDGEDKCPCTDIPDQSDSDGDGFGDICDPFPGVPATTNPATKPDYDSDGIPDDHDNCPCVPNSGQEDGNTNNVGDVCDRGCEIVLIELHVYGNGSEGRIAISQPSGITRSGLRGDTSAIDIAVQPLPPLPPVPPVWVRDSILTRVLDEKVYELKDHLGNVRVVISDVKAPVSQSGAAPFGVTLRRYTNYYPFGMAQPGRSYEALTNGEYRYGFQGQEGVKEWGGSLGNGELANMNSFDSRTFDSRTGRWLSLDPKGQFPSLYVGMSNNPIMLVDPDGSWVPGMDDDGNVILTADEGDDNASLLSYFSGYGLSNEQTRSLMESTGAPIGDPVAAGVEVNLTTVLEGPFRLMTEAYLSIAPDVGTIEQQIQYWSGQGPDDFRWGGGNSGFNCFGSCFAILEGRVPDQTIDNIGDIEAVWARIDRDFVDVGARGAVVANTVVTFGDPEGRLADQGTSTPSDDVLLPWVPHGALFVGSDRNGQRYVFSKNGPTGKPGIMKIDDMDVIYPGTPNPTGINIGESGYYNLSPQVSEDEAGTDD